MPTVRPGYFTPYYPSYFTSYFPGSGGIFTPSPSGSPPPPPPPGPSRGGYFTSYRPGYFTPYDPGSGGISIPRPSGPSGPPGTSSPITAGHRGYFTGYRPLYFTGYFPGAGGLAGASGTVLPGTFLAAVRRVLTVDGVLSGMCPGGVWHRIAPPRTPQPLIVYSIQSDNRVNSSYKSFVEPGQIRFTVYAPADSLARTAADRAVDVLTDAHLAWSLNSGRTMYLTLNTPLSSDPPTPGYGGSDTFAAMRVLDFVYQGQESP